MGRCPISGLSALGLGPAVQIAYAVADLSGAIETWKHQFGVRRFVVREHIPLASARVNGLPTAFDHSSAYGQWGEVMVELVQQHTPPVGAASGIHHCAHFVDDFDAAQASLTAAGYAEVLCAQAEGGTTFAFHDARHTLGHLIEIYEPTPRLRDFYQHIRELSLQ